MERDQKTGGRKRLVTVDDVKREIRRGRKNLIEASAGRAVSAGLGQYDFTNEEIVMMAARANTRGAS